MTTLAVDPTVRYGTVYAYLVLHPISGQIVVGYVGQTRALGLREQQHRADKPWADTITGAWWRDPTSGRMLQAVVVHAGMLSDTDLDELELAAIRALKPLYNIQGNEANEQRIKPWAAVEQRHARDRAAGRPLWQAPTADRRRPGMFKRRPAPAVVLVPRRASRSWWPVLVPAQLLVLVFAGVLLTTNRPGFAVAAAGAGAAVVVAYRLVRTWIGRWWR